MTKQEREEFNMAVVNAYDEYLQATEKRGVSYGECAYIESLSDKEAKELLEECYNILDMLASIPESGELLKIKEAIRKSVEHDDR